MQVYLNEIASGAQTTLTKLAGRADNIAAIVIMLLPFSWISLSLFRTIIVRRWHWLLPLSCLSATPLYALGVDFFRWTAAIHFNLWFSIIVNAVIVNRQEMLIQSLFDSKTYRRVLWLAIAMCIYLGPIGVSTFLPERGALIRGVAAKIHFAH